MSSNSSFASRGGEGRGGNDPLIWRSPCGARDVPATRRADAYLTTEIVHFTMCEYVSLNGLNSFIVCIPFIQSLTYHRVDRVVRIARKRYHRCILSAMKRLIVLFVMFQFVVKTCLLFN